MAVSLWLFSCQATYLNRCSFLFIFMLKQNILSRYPAFCSKIKLLQWKKDKIFWIVFKWCLRPDWTIFESSWQQMLLQKQPKYLEKCLGFSKSITFKIKTVVSTFLATFKEIWQFLFSHLVTLPAIYFR